MMTEKPEPKIVRNITDKEWSEIFNDNSWRYKPTDQLLAINGNGDQRRPVSVTRDKPVKIGEYSLDSNHRMVFDRSLVKYIHLPANTVKPMDLLEGYVQGINWTKSMSTNVYKMGEWIDKGYRPQPTASYEQLVDTDFFCGRTPLAYIMTFPYEKYEPLIITATKFRGNIYLFDYRKPQPPPDEEFNRISFSGHRFEQYITSDDQNRPNDSQVFINDRSGYVGIVKTQLNDVFSGKSHKIVISGEIDCLTRDARPESATVDQFVEIKTTTSLKPFKQMKWWSQCYLVGIPTIYFGYRDNNFRVNQLQRISVDSLHNYRCFWSPNECLNFLYRFLSFVKQVVAEDNPNVVYRFEFRPQIGVTYTKLEEPGVFRILDDKYVQKYAN